MRPGAPTAAVPPLVLLATPTPRTRVLLRGSAVPGGRIEICAGCRRRVVVLEPGELSARCHRCTQPRAA